MNDIPLSPPFSFTASDENDLFPEFRARMESDEAANTQVVGGAVTSPMRIPSLLDPLSKIVNGRKSLETYLTYCKEFLDLDLYPKLSEQDRAVILDFISGEILQNAQWKYLFPTGSFECILNTTAGPETDEYSCTECTVFKINFEQLSCSKDVRRVWNAKIKSKADEPLTTLKVRSGGATNSDSEEEDGDERNESLELQSPIKQPTKRRTPTRRRSFEERERRRSTSRASRSMSNEPPSKKAKDSTSADEADNKMQVDDTPAKKKTSKKTAPTSGEKPKRGRPKKTSIAKSQDDKENEKEAAATDKPKKKASVKKTRQQQEAEEQTWEVLSIVNHKKVSGKYQYLVQWAGLDPEGKPWDDTWEPHYNISEDLIRDYWARHQETLKKSPDASSPTKALTDAKVTAQSLLNMEPKEQPVV